MAGIKGKSGAKPGNKNALRNGSNIDRKRLTVGELPTAMIAVKREARSYRRTLEAAVLQARDEVTLMDAHTIDAATACTMAAGIGRWLLRNRFEVMTVADIRATNKEIRDAKRDRAKIVRELDLDGKPPDPWEQLDALDATPVGKGDTDGD